MLLGICHVLFHPVSTRWTFSLQRNCFCFPRTSALKFATQGNTAIFQPCDFTVLCKNNQKKKPIINVELMLKCVFQIGLLCFYYLCIYFTKGWMKTETSYVLTLANFTWF